MADIDIAVRDRIMTLTLNRPERMNAFVPDMYVELAAALDRADADDDVRVVVITGAGRGFCSGVDLARGADTFDYPDGPRHRDRAGKIALRMYESTVPIIGAINGAAVGFGATMTLPMDIRIASTEAKFGFVFARRGIVSEACASWFLPRAVGISRSMEWLTTGRIFGADEAKDAGLVRSVHQPDELMDAAYALASEIAENTAPVAVALARQMLWRLHASEHPMDSHEVESRALESLGRSADVKAAVTAFGAGERPRFEASPSRDMPSFYPWWQERDFSPLPDSSRGH